MPPSCITYRYRGSLHRLILNQGIANQQRTIMFTVTVAHSREEGEPLVLIGDIHCGQILYPL